jgi:decaprenylphospho-beta-D-ribofuranose 2-oxidase
MRAPRPTTLTGWGRQSRLGLERRGEDLEGLGALARLSRGLGRSYGDSSLPASKDEIVLNTTLADRILAFEEQTGLVRAEAGLSLVELHRITLPKLLFAPVTPGTQFVTLGGMVAADVHGKNQHSAGNFGDHVTRLRVRVADGRVVECSPDEHADLFAATVGGMGLTGHILEVEFRLERIPSPWIVQESIRIEDVDRFQDELEASAREWPFTMGWIDAITGGESLGRGVLYRGRWATADEAKAGPPRRRRKASLPMDFPGWVLNPLSIRAFNALKYHSHMPRVQRGLVGPDEFFYPLDAIHDWHRMYGARGFTQYQCVLPRRAGKASARRVLELLSELGAASFLCVIKDFGREGRGILSFPEPGVTLAIDIPIRPDTPRVVRALNALVLEEGGRIYLAKDSFTTASELAEMDPRVEEFRKIRDKWDPARRFRSAQSVRLFGDSA